MTHTHCGYAVCCRYSRKDTRGGKSKLRGTLQLRLRPPDANGRVTLEPIASFLPAGCAAPREQPTGAAQATGAPHAAQGEAPNAPAPVRTAQGPFRLVHGTCAQPFALSFDVSVHEQVARVDSRKGTVCRPREMERRSVCPPTGPASIRGGNSAT
jgi:hypothetical protein